MRKEALSEDSISLEDLARLRQGVYRVLGSVFLYPDSEWLKTIPPLAEALLQETQSLQEFAFWIEWAKLLEGLSSLDESARCELEILYSTDFLNHEPTTESCCPFESIYIPRENIPSLMGDLDCLYSEAGFSVSSSTHQTPDHASVQLEFLSLLCGREADAWTEESSEEATKHLKRQEQFLGTHLGVWFARFSSVFRAKKFDHFYSLGCHAVESFIAHEMDLLPQIMKRYGKVMLK